MLTWPSRRLLGNIPRLVGLDEASKRQEMLFQTLALNNHLSKISVEVGQQPVRGQSPIKYWGNLCLSKYSLNFIFNIYHSQES